MVSCWPSSTQIRNKNIFLQIQTEKYRGVCGAPAVPLAQGKLTGALATTVLQSKVGELVAAPVSPGVFLSSYSQT